MDIEKEIKGIVATYEQHELFKGCSENNLQFLGDISPNKAWCFEIGNGLSCVSLGEAGAELEFYGSSIEGVLTTTKAIMAQMVLDGCVDIQKKIIYDKWLAELKASAGD